MRRLQQSKSFLLECLLHDGRSVLYICKNQNDLMRQHTYLKNRRKEFKLPHTFKTWKNQSEQDLPYWASNDYEKKEEIQSFNNHIFEGYIKILKMKNTTTSVHKTRKKHHYQVIYNFHLPLKRIVRLGSELNHCKSFTLWNIFFEL